MNRTRIIPVLTISKGKLVKTVGFKKPNYIGDPINAIKIFNDKEVDELAILDIDASTSGQGPNFELIEEMAGECFMPLAYGGGVSSIEQAGRLYQSGVEKIILNSALATSEALITELAGAYGSQSVVASLDVKKKFLKGLVPCFQSASETNKRNILEQAKALEAAGAGELILHHTDRDGTFQGLDQALTKEIVDGVSVPVITCGGASGVQDILETVSQTGVSAVAAGSIFVYKGQNRNSILISYPKQHEIYP